MGTWEVLNPGSAGWSGLPAPQVASWEAGTACFWLLCRGFTFCGDGTTSGCRFAQILMASLQLKGRNQFTQCSPQISPLFPSNSASEQRLGVGVLREDRGPDGPDRSGAQVHGRIPNPDSGDVKGPTDFSGEALWLSNTPRSLGSPCSSA